MKKLLAVLAIAVAVAFAPHALADIVSPLTSSIDFNEYPFPVPTQILQGPNGSSSVSYNLFDDATGTELGADNGDLDDITITYTASTPGSLGIANRPSIEINPTATNQLTGRTGFEGTVGANNPGTRQSYSIEVRFADHLDITDVTIDTNSLNTAGISWEFTVVSFLDKSGATFSPIPTIDPHAAFAPGMTGASGTGHFVAAETGTVLDVGTNQTSSGTNGSHDQVDDTISASDVTLPGNPLIGGFILTTTLEDVRGTANGATNFSSSIRRVDISGTITQFVPDADVAISMTGTATPDQVVYEISVVNNGPDAATNVVVTDNLPPELIYVSDSCGGTEVPPWTWQIGILSGGETATCTLVTEIATFGLIENTAIVFADEDDPDPDNNTATNAIVTSPLATTTLPGATPTTTDTLFDTLPFTGRPTGTTALIAIGLLSFGALILAAGSRGPSISISRRRT